MKHRILLVEDDPAYGEFLKFWLESEGHEAILAETLEDGFVKIATEPQPDVVLLDVNLGKHNGLTLAHWARKQRHLAHLTIAAITGVGAFKDLKSIEEAGCDTCFVKPIDLGALREYLSWLRVPSAHCEPAKLTR
ncbi:MAG TPA: response regulator [Candidatus Sulfotelmatobacter sp.]|jgi:DNA-binding response OmpR family regulator|nr:response regulator [Candidatus Sulfotelmatobacter sp.]